MNCKNYYLEESIENLLDESCETREEALECIENYFKSNFTKEQLLELIIRGQAHANEDKRVPADFFNR